MTETEQSRLYWANRRRDEREEVGLAPEPEPEQRSRWHGCDRDCFRCPYTDCMDPGTDLNDFERECLEIGHQEERSHPNAAGNDR